MFWKKRATVGHDERDWTTATWQWLDNVLGPVDQPDARKLILPGRSVFPDTPLTGHDRAQFTFDLVRHLCRMDDRPCELVAQQERPQLGSSVVFGEVRSSGALGTYSRAGNAAVITYDPALLGNTIGLVATFVHELAHDKLSGTHEPPPGGAELVELATDLATVHLGFGLFGANSAFEFRQSASYDRQGWSYSQSGYLSESLWCYATALFCELTSTPVAGYSAYCKDTVLSGIKKNRAFLAENRDIVRGLQHRNLRSALRETL